MSCGTKSLQSELLLEFGWLLWGGLGRLGMYLIRRLYTLVNATGWLACVVEGLSCHLDTILVEPFTVYDLEFWRRGECSRGLFTLFVLDE